MLRKVAAPTPFSHVLLNRGALTQTTDHRITVRGLRLAVNGVDHRQREIHGLRGQLAFLHVRDLRIEGFRCEDLGAQQFAIQVCSFEYVHIANVIVRGDKDGVHLGRGRRFTIRDGVFQTFDDAIALNGHDYASGNPELGWIEDGVIENCHDLDAPRTTGYFCRLLAGGWGEWRPGMEVRQSDTVISEGRLYRVQAEPDGRIFISRSRPTHPTGQAVLDGIPWGMVQADPTGTAGVRGVTFRDIFLHKARIGFSFNFDHDRYSRSYYPGAPVPVQTQIAFENVRVRHDQPVPVVAVNTPVDQIHLDGASLGPQPVEFRGNGALAEQGATIVRMTHCTFRHGGPMDVVRNTMPGRVVRLETIGSTVLDPHFRARVEGNGVTVTASDLPGLGRTPAD